MAVIIGFSTNVTGYFSGSKIASVSWGYNPNTQRLYALGNMAAYKTISRPTETMSVVLYSGTGPGPYDTSPSTNCNTSGISAGVSPGACELSVDGVSGTKWYVTSYSFQKGDPGMPGQETWGLQQWVASSTITEPTHVIRGASEGQATDASKCGITFTGTTEESTTGSVSAGGVGNADTLTVGQVSSIGNSNAGAGDIDNGSVSIQYTPLWI